VYTPYFKYQVFPFRKGYFEKVVPCERKRWVYRLVIGQQKIKMTNELEIATENLYKTFSKYPFKSTIEGCPCCVSDSDKSTLHSKQLRELEDDDLSR